MGARLAHWDRNMFEKPIVLGIFSQQVGSGVTLQQLFSNYGNNTGNMLFSESLLRGVSGATRGHLGFSEADIEERDCIILAAANWLNPGMDFAGLAARLEKTKLPVIAVGLGAQSPLDQSMPVLKEGTKRLINLISERSASVSVRGAFSGEVLAHYGVKNVAVTGCPSLLLAGKSAPKLRTYNPEDQQAISVGATRHGFHGTDSFQLYIYRQAAKQNLELILQSELADMYFSLRRLNNTDILQKSTELLTKTYGVDEKRLHQYLCNKAKVFFDLDEWISHMTQRSLYVGTRLHGAVAALLAGTPATLIAHDSRTLEVAECLHIPYVRSSDIDTQTDCDFRKLHRSECLRNFEQGYRQYLEGFLDFFETVSLKVSLGA